MNVNLMSASHGRSYLVCSTVVLAAKSSCGYYCCVLEMVRRQTKNMKNAVEQLEIHLLGCVMWLMWCFPVTDNQITDHPADYPSFHAHFNTFCFADMLNISGVIMAEKLQDLGSSYSKPFFQTYWIHSFYSVMYIFWKLWL